jgi:hypothetical protein
MSQGKKGPNKREQQRIRMQQLIFGVIAVLIILSWVIGMLINV